MDKQAMAAKSVSRHDGCWVELQPASLSDGCPGQQLSNAKKPAMQIRNTG